MLIILISVTVSWVIFIFNFVLGYYIGRAVEAGEKLKERRNKKKEMLKNKSIVSKPLFSQRITTAN